MKYMGSKNRISKYIVPIIEKYRSKDMVYVEPFVGGANMIDKIDGIRIGADKNKYLIAMWIGLLENRKIPYNISKDIYTVARDIYNNRPTENNTGLIMDDFMIGWIGWMASFNGRFFDGGYSGSTDTRNYIDEQIRNTEKQVASLSGCSFIYCDYKELPYPDNSLIYCDIPYKNTKQYSVSKDFNHEEFWEWCRKMSKCGHIILVSEYNAPSDFKCIWEKEVTNSLNTTKTTRPTERLFIIENT